MTERLSDERVREAALVDLVGDMLEELTGMDGRPHMPSMKTLVQWQHRYDELLPTFADVRGILAPAPTGPAAGAEEGDDGK